MFKYHIILGGLLLLTLPVGAAEPSPAEAKLREQLRNSLLQARTLQSEKETLEAEKNQVAAEKQTLSTQLEARTKQAAADQEEASKRLAVLEARSASQTGEIERLSESLSKWKASQQEAVALAQNKEAARARLAQEKIELQRQVADQRTRNLAMYKTGTEILARYESFGLGTAITAREPFVGTTRVRLENLVQDSADKLAEQRIAPAPALAAKPVSSAKPVTRQTTSPTASPRNIGAKPIDESGQPARPPR